MPETLKLSVHSGSDKFSIYAPIRRALKATGAGLHIKTAGTTWLEELIGLAEAGGEGLVLAKEIYTEALANREALCEPYATVIDVDIAQLPSAETVNNWTASNIHLPYATTNPTLASTKACANCYTLDSRLLPRWEIAI